MSSWLIVLIVLWLLLLFEGGDKVPDRRYSLSAQKYNEDTGRPEALGIHKVEDIHTHAVHTAKTMLDTIPEATIIEVYDHDTERYEYISRLS